MGKTSPSSQGCAPALAGQPKSPAVRWSRLCTPCLLPAFPSLLLPHRVILPAAAAALRAPSPALTLACFYFPPSVVLLCRQQRGQRPHEPSSAWRCPAAVPATEATAHTHPTSEPSLSRAVGVSPKGGDTRRGSVPSASLGAGERHQVLREPSIGTLCLPRGTDRRGRLSGARTPGAGGQLKAAPPHSSPLPTTHVQKQRELSGP